MFSSILSFLFSKSSATSSWISFSASVSNSWLIWSLLFPFNIFTILLVEFNFIEPFSIENMSTISEWNVTFIFLLSSTLLTITPVISRATEYLNAVSIVFSIPNTLSSLIVFEYDDGLLSNTINLTPLDLSSSIF